MKRLLEDQVLPQLDKMRLVVNESSDKTDYTTSKINMIEKHLPMMITLTLALGMSKGL